MAPRVLYLCPCTFKRLNIPEEPAAGARDDHVPTFIPPVPSADAGAAHGYMPLDYLYFCEECSALRCRRCTTSDVASFYCPLCLFDMQAVNVKADRNRCPRSCFVCPSCSHGLTITATDPSHTADPLTPAASVGQAPYYLSCSFCRWDSKEIGVTFDKPTGLALQLQATEEHAPDILEYERLLAHLEAPLRQRGAGRRAGATATPGAGSKLLRDLQFLALPNHASSTGVSANTEAAWDALPPYAAFTAYTSGQEAGNRTSLGPLASKAEYATRWVGKALGAPSNTEPNEGGFYASATLEQKWDNGWDQPVRARGLMPLRAPLKTKVTRRCGICSHILVRPDVKAGMTKFKIKLLASTYLPLLDCRPTNPQPAWATSLNRDRDRALRGHALHFPTQHSLSLSHGLDGPESRGDAAARLAKRASILTLSRRQEEEGPLDTNRLLPGHTYVFELTLTNPLEDGMKVRLYVGPSPVASVRVPVETEAGTEEITKQVRLWRLVPSTSSFDLGAASMLPLDDEDELLGPGRGNEYDAEDGSGDGSVSGSASESDSEDDYAYPNRYDAEAHVGKRERLSGPSGTATEEGKKKRRPKGRGRGGIVRRRANATTIALELDLGKHAQGPVEAALRVSFSYTPDGAAAPAARARTTDAEDDQRALSFWTSVLLGHCAPRQSEHTHSGPSAHAHSTRPTSGTTSSTPPTGQPEEARATPTASTPTIDEASETPTAASAAPPAGAGSMPRPPPITVTGVSSSSSLLSSPRADAE